MLLTILRYSKVAFQNAIPTLEQAGPRERVAMLATLKDEGHFDPWMCCVAMWKELAKYEWSGGWGE